MARLNTAQMLEHFGIDVQHAPDLVPTGVSQACGMPSDGLDPMENPSMFKSAEVGALALRGIGNAMQIV